MGFIGENNLVGVECTYTVFRSQRFDVYGVLITQTAVFFVLGKAWNHVLKRYGEVGSFLIFRFSDPGQSETRTYSYLD